MSRITIVTFILLLSFSSQAAAYAVCDTYKFGSQEWWECQASQGPAQVQIAASRHIW